MLLYGFIYSWIPLLVAIFLGIGFLKTGFAGWAAVIGLAGAAGLILDSLITEGELFPFSGIVGAIYGMFLWSGLWFLNRSALDTQK
jgi:hypothetical protein